MTDLEAQARALGDPTRHAIFRHIVEVDRPIGIAELNEHFPLNHNAIRQHVAKLVAAGLVEESVGRSDGGRGRPPLRYTVDPSAEGRWGTTGPYERLSVLLVEVIRSGLDPVEVGRRAADRFRSTHPSGDAVDDLAAAMARQGFAPDVHPARHGADIVLQHCPFATTALADRDTVCALHLGIAEGLAAPYGARVDELVAHDPRTAQCRIRVRTDGVDASEGQAHGTLTLRRRTRRRSG